MAIGTRSGAASGMIDLILLSVLLLLPLLLPTAPGATDLISNPYPCYQFNPHYRFFTDCCEMLSLWYIDLIRFDIPLVWFLLREALLFASTD